MCGFVGGTDPSWNFEAALATILHRGPDTGRLVPGVPFTVGFRRLSIVDLRDDRVRLGEAFGDRLRTRSGATLRL
jgi:asparagine synthetase B (glutamine-hydrolysing)